MAPLPYTDASAKRVFVVLIAVFVALELVARVRSRSNQRGVGAEWRSFAIVLGSIYLGVAAGFLAASKLESLAIHFVRWPLFVLGAALIAAGIVVRHWAIAVLGASFTPEVRVRPNQPVVEAGPYRWLSHPAYTGMIMSFLGIGLMLGNWGSLALLGLVPTAGLLYRIRVEERALLAGLGEPYRRFLAGRARLLPGVW